MNTVVTSKEGILEKSKFIAKHQGLDNISIREVANACNIAVGSIYNYFPSKADLLSATVEEIWKEIFHASGRCKESRDFLTEVKSLYACIFSGTKEYPSFFKLHFQGFHKQEKAKGKEVMDGYMSHMQEGLLKVLKEDNQVKSNAFDELPPDDFIQFVFSNMMLALSNHQEQCDTLLIIIKKLLYAS